MTQPSIAMGLDAIFSAEKQNIQENPTQKNLVISVPIPFISPSPYQARKDFTSSHIESLAASIKANGILQPLLVRSIGDNRYELLAGERRLRASQCCGLAEVPVIVCNVDNESAMAFGLIENIQRKNLNAIEEAEAYQRLLTEFSLTHEALSARLGKSRSHITNLLRLNQLEPYIKDNIVSDAITMGHARALLTLEIQDRLHLAKMIIEKQLSVRETEFYVKKLLNKTENSGIKSVIQPDYSAKLSRYFGCDFRVTQQGEQYKVQGDFKSESAFLDFLDKLN